ncbi:hypothetical protein PpBr36_07306 [Pyricularia pennisetigena]|uniref:hypothetical protein n=1 Tax=Pyricularia pennisetigena TaxID=1578925 RepID=UPI001150305D|nr:hypothetical protein PpBr36_07306 [Pyricularia pennisetigena]TLS25578.1 hypothetical protein PpBr36_07306 [Pyricularia pennisetigena]
MTTPRFLPSSPPSQARPDLYTTLISSSPDLPSINELVSRYAKKPKPLHSGSSAASIPATVTPTFTTAAKLLQSAQAEQADTLETLPPPRVRAKAKPKQRDSPEVVDLSADPPVHVLEHQPEKRKARKTANGVNKKTSGRKEETVAEDAATGVTTPTKSQSWKVFKSPSPRTTANPEITGVQEVADTTAPAVTSATESAKVTASAPNKVTKSKVRKTSTAASRKKKAETVSKHFAVPDDAPTAPEPITVPDDAPEEQLFTLEPAVARRLDWTPPRETETAGLCPASSSSKEVTSTLDSTLSAAPAALQDVFLTLQDKFAYPVEQVTRRTDSPSRELAPPVEVIKKRKVIQLVGPPNDSKIHNQTSPVKSKAPKKKPRTITDLATAAYTTEGKQSNAPSKRGTLTSYLEGQGEQVFQHCHPDSRLRNPERKRKPKGRGQVLLSPLSAIDQSARQDFVFGTSSQLAQEHSPTFLRDLHAALKQSNDLSDDPFASPITAATEGRKLWNAGARGEEGDLMNIEVIDLVDSPAFPDDPDAIVRAEMQKSPIRSEPKGAENRRISTVNLDPTEIDISKPHAPDLESTNSAGHASKTQTSKSIHFACITPPIPAKITMVPTRENTAESSIVASDGDSDNEPPPSNQQAYQIPPPPRPFVTEETAIPRPNYEVMTDIQLSKQVSNYGFKSVKKRSAMIALLNQCWESKAGATAAAGQSSALSTTSQTSAARGPRGKTSTAAAAAKSPTKRPRGRPRKNSAGASGDIAAIEATTPVKRPRGRPKKNSQGECSPERVQSISASVQPTGVAAVQTPRRRKKAATQPMVEILDSDGEAGLSPSPSLSPEPVFSSPEKGVDVSIGEDTTMSLAANPTAQQAELFLCITRAVKSAPRSTDPAKPSWHEKMLMYDPIVLEDLAAWLNAGQLDRVGYDGEVAPTDVKMWCESKSRAELWPEGKKPSSWLESTTLTVEASIVLISPQNEVLLLRRTATSSAFPDAYVFPGGNLSKFHEPGMTTEMEGDCPEFRMAAIRETFEESGILLAVDNANQKRLLELSDTDRELGRKKVHSNEIKFDDWLASTGGVPDTGNLFACTRWITPKPMARRFNTQMYIYLLPLEAKADSVKHVPTSDGGLEHTEAVFAPPREWLRRVRLGEIVLFPPQIYLLSLVADHLQPEPDAGPRDLSAGRESLVSYLKATPEDGVPWADKVITPEVTALPDDVDSESAGVWRGKVILSLTKPKGVTDKVVLVDFQRAGPMYGEVAARDEILKRPAMKEKL